MRDVSSVMHFLFLSYDATHPSVSPHGSNGTTHDKCSLSNMVLPCCITWLEIHCLHGFAFVTPPSHAWEHECDLTQNAGWIFFFFFNNLNIGTKAWNHSRKQIVLIYLFFSSLKEPKPSSSSLQGFESIFSVTVSWGNVMVSLTVAGQPNLLLRLVFSTIFKTCHATIRFLGTFCRILCTTWKIWSTIQNIRLYPFK